MSWNRQRYPDQTKFADVLVCPDCSKQLKTEQLRCRNCGSAAVEKNGVISFPPTTSERSRWLTESELAEFAEAAANWPIRDAAHEVAEGTEYRTEFLEEVFDVRRELWQPLVAEHISGRCLDLYASYGRRSMVLAEQADSVYAVDPSLEKLRIAVEREDYASSDHVFPIHTTTDRLPFRRGSFDTIFADLAGKGAIRPSITRLKEYLSEDGSLLFLADGWTRSGGITNLFGLDTDQSTGSLAPGTPAGYRDLVESIGFDAVSIYAIAPTALRPLYAFDINCSEAVTTIFESYARHHGVVGRYIKQVMALLTKTGILKKCFPSFLVVCSNSPKPSAPPFSTPLVVSGRTRSVVLDIGVDGIDMIHKIPNRADHAPFTERENRVTSTLSSKSDPIAATIPEGNAVVSELGSARTVRPVAGRPLDEAVGRDAVSMERVLQIGFDWLAKFQRALGGEPISKSPSEVREDLLLGPVNTEPPVIDESLTTFTTPVHGDFMSGNIYYEGGEITSVIDWEYGSLAGSPVVDAGYFLLNTAAWAISNFEERIRTVLCGRNEYARRARKRVREYCDAIGLPYRTFEVYLPAAYLHQLSIDWRLNSVSTFSTRSTEQVQRVQTLYDALDEMNIS